MIGVNGNRARAIGALRLRLLIGREYDARRTPAIVAAVAPNIESLELASDLGDVGLFVCARTDRLPEVRPILQTLAAEVAVELAVPPALQRPLVGWELTTRFSDALPLAARASNQFDLPSALAGLLASAEDVRAIFQVVIEPEYGTRWRKQALRGAAEVAPGGVSPRWLHALQQETFDKAASQHLFRSTIRFAAASSCAAPARRAVSQVFELVGSAFATSVNNVQAARLPSGEEFARRLVHRLPGAQCMLRPDELDALWHPPAETAMVPGLARGSKAVRSPRDARTGDLHIGHDMEGRDLFIKHESRRQMAVVAGATGAGKSTLVARSALADIAAGRGVAVVDPKGDLIDTILARFPAERASDLVLFDPSRETVVPFNALARRGGVSPHHVADDVCSALRRLFPDTWGHRIERVLRHALVALQAVDGSTLLDLYAFLIDARFRQRVLAHSDDEFTLRFWRDEFDELSPGTRLQWVEPVLNRLHPFLGDPLIRRVIGSARGLDLRELMDEGRILLADLSQGRLGSQNSFVLANLLMSSFQRAALSRVDTLEERRLDFDLWVDEAHAAAPATFVKMLSELRVFRVRVHLVTQFLHQLPPDVVEAMLANAGTIIAFRLGEPDARLLAARLGPEFSLADLVGMDNYVAAARLVSGGHVLRPFSVCTEPLPPGRGLEWARELRESSLARYGVAPEERRIARDIDTAAEPLPLEVEWHPA